MPGSNKLRSAQLNCWQWSRGYKARISILCCRLTSKDTWLCSVFPMPMVTAISLLLVGLMLLARVPGSGTCMGTAIAGTPVIATTTTLAPTTTTTMTTTAAATSTTTTTPAPTTSSTTTTTTTTTTTLLPCAQCTLDTITLTMGDGVNTITPTTPGVQCCDAAGCSFLVVTCTAPPGSQVFMQFNINQGGPLNPIGTVVTALLNCNAMMQWEFRPGMGLPNRVITEVNCINAGGG